MKNFGRILIFFILGVTYVQAETNNTVLTMDHIDKISGILEPSAGILAAQIMHFGIFITFLIAVASAFYYFAIIKQSDKIEKLIINEVKNQIVYSLNGELEKAQVYARQRIDYETKDIKKSANEKLFEHHELIYQVNQKMKEESDKILQNKNFKTEDKLSELASLKYRYSEITDHDLPKLFSDDIKTIIQTAKELSEHQNIKSIIIYHLSGLLDSSQQSEQNKEKIKQVLKDYFKYNMK